MCNFTCNLRCFVATVLSQIYALLSVKFSGLKTRECKKMTNIRYVQTLCDFLFRLILKPFYYFIYDTFLPLEDWNVLNYQACVNLDSQNIVKHENLKYSDNLVRKIVLRYWKLLNYAVCEPLCQWSQLTQEERGEEESSIFKTAKIKKLPK